MPLRIGLLLYPLVPFLIAVSRRSAATVFAKAGAVSALTARRPSSLDVRDDLASLVRKGIMVRLDDGRYYVVVAKHRRRQRMQALGIGAIFAVPLFALTALWVYEHV